VSSSVGVSVGARALDPADGIHLGSPNGIESLEGFDYFSKRLQGEELSIDDEGHLVFRVGNSPSHGLVRSLVIAGFTFFDVPRGEHLADSSANSAECQIRAVCIQLSEVESVSLFSFFLCLDAKSKTGVEVGDYEGPLLTSVLCKSVWKRKITVRFFVFPRFIGNSPTGR